ncbi:profilin-1-like [Haliotis rubra]|uniref:profilin-1-like n=1 Tax=Haliotis rubra TaxID=36100 RepID=UPI001EE52AEB|nr:profilin-1-like [Haliotis rubra]
MSEQSGVQVPLCSKQRGPQQNEENDAKTEGTEYVSKPWDRYISDFLIGSNHVSDAAIIERSSGQYLSSTTGFEIYEDEFEEICQSLCNAQLAYRRGVTINNKHYQTRLADGSCGIYARTASDGCSVCQTSCLVIIGVSDHKCKSKSCNEEVMRLGDYLFSKGM